MKANRILDVIVGDDTNVDYISLEITTRAGLPAYIAVLLDPNTQRISASVLDSQNTQLIGPNTLIDKAYRFGRPSATRATDTLNSIDLIWQQDPNGAIVYRRFNADLQSVSTSNLHLFNNGSPTHLIALAPDHLRAFRAVSFDSPIDYRDIFDSTNTSPSDDRDNDGVPDNLDAFPDDPAASIDTDGDGMPDDWNPSATAEQIAASTLIVDDDDDGDGTLDVDDYFPLDPTKVGTSIQDALVAIVDPRLRECLENTINSLFPNAIYAEQVTRFACGADSIEGLRAFSRLEEVYIGNNFTDISELRYLNYMSSLTLNDGLSVDSLEPLRDKINLRYLQLYAADQDAYTDVILTLTGLEGLQFQYSNIPVLPDYSALPNLRRLDMYRTNTGHIVGFSLTQLERLASFDNPLVDIGPVSSLTNLTFLALTDANATDISSLANLVNVTELLLGGNDFASLTELSG